MASVTLEAVTKRFGTFTAVKAMDLDVRDGEFVAILGPSGCGKTTTMNMIAGIESVSAGTIRFDERDVTAVPMSRRGVGFVFQNYAIFTHMSVRKNLAFGLEIRRLPAEEIRRRVEDMADFMSLSHRLGEPAAGLSVNELQKLAIGRSAIVEPPIFLLDEPLSNLDAAFRERMRADLRQLQRTLGQTMIYVTHDQIEAMGLADRIAVMDQAVLQQFDTPEGIYARPANVFVAEFIGAPSMNILAGRITGEGTAIDLGGRPADRIPLGAELAAAARASRRREVLFGFRPEALSLVEAGTSGAVAAGVALVELVGRRRIVHCTTGTSEFIGVFDHGFAPQAGDSVALAIDAGRAHLFDQESKARLDAPAAGRRDV